MSPQHTEFAARIARIERGIGSCRTTLFVGLDESFAVTYAARMATGRFQMASNALYPLSVLLAFVVGMASDLVARLVDFMSTGLPDATAHSDLSMMTDFVIAMMLSVVIGAVLGLAIRNFMVARSLGIVAGMLGMHNAVHLWPDLFERVFSPIWVGYMLNATEPRSLVWRGVSFVF